jgi:hypothetical protein
MQLPTPPPDPNIIIPQIIPVFGMLTGLFITGFVVLGPVGRAIGDVLRHIFGAHKRDALPAAAELDEFRDRLDTLQHQVAELAEREEFSERMLAQMRRERQLPGASDVAR